MYPGTWALSTPDKPALGDNAPEAYEVAWAAHPGTAGKSLLGIPRVCDPPGNELPLRDRYADGVPA